jgi:(p)ppGpp synthase/HD superfamily hydrolase
MIYTDLTKKALKISFYAHKNQVDKNGMPYVYHPFHIAEQMDDEYSTCVALLHDVVEDTDITLSDLKSHGFPDELIEALSLMTHSDGVPYFDYIRAMKDNPLARKVKLADLAHNSDLSRLDKVDEKATERFYKYKQAVLILQRAEESYR